MAQVGNTAYAYDANGNVISATGGQWRSISYTSFNLPNEDAVNGGIGGTGGLRYAWRYGPDHERLREERRSAAGTRTTWSFHPDNKGGLFFEQETGETGTVTNRHYLAGGAGVFAVFASTGAGSAAITRRDYWHVDHLGSIVAVSDATGTVSQRFAYDPFGKRRFTNGSFDAGNELFIDWTRFANRNAAGTLFTTLLGSERGFTGHEHLDDLGLIHMNGRIFDPLIGRFLQADPFVQFPDALAAYNRYSYVLNNPLNATDPTGYFLKRLWRNKNFRLLVSIVVSAWIGYGDFSWIGGTTSGLSANVAGNAFVSGFVSGAINSGSLEGAFMGAFTSMAFFGAGQFANGMDLSAVAEGGFAANSSGLWGSTGIGRALVHASAGCMVSGMQGGDCGQGALSAGLTKYAGSNLAGPVAGFDDVLRETAVQAAIGGTVSKLTGGSFGNGAMNAAYQYLFNELSHGISKEQAGYEVRRGGLNYGEAVDHWQSGGGMDVRVPLSSLDLSQVTAADFPLGVGSTVVVNLSGRMGTNFSDQLVYGNVTLKLVAPGVVEAGLGYDRYNFDIKPWTRDTVGRNLATLAASTVNSSAATVRNVTLRSGQGYFIQLDGQAKIGPR